MAEQRRPDERGRHTGARYFRRRRALWCHLGVRTTSGDRTGRGKSKSNRAEFGGFIVKRILSFLIVILIAALILASVVLNAWTASVGSIFGSPCSIIEAASFAVSFLLLFALFAVIFKYFPDAEVAWSDVKTGAFVTAALFEVGRFLLAMYLGRDDRQACTEPPVH